VSPGLHRPVRFAQIQQLKTNGIQMNDFQLVFGQWRRNLIIDPGNVPDIFFFVGCFEHLCQIFEQKFQVGIRLANFADIFDENRVHNYSFEQLKHAETK
jgi:hypothetical protein